MLEASWRWHWKDQGEGGQGVTGWETECGVLGRPPGGKRASMAKMQQWVSGSRVCAPHLQRRELVSSDRCPAGERRFQGRGDLTPREPAALHFLHSGIPRSHVTN